MLQTQGALMKPNLTNQGAVAVLIFVTLDLNLTVASNFLFFKEEVRWSKVFYFSFI